MNIKTRANITEIITILFVILFLYTGISKLMGDFLVFKEQIATTSLLEPVSPIIAAMLPWVEFSAALMLVVPRWRLKGFYVSLSLMMLFTVYIITMLTFNKDVPCNCGGIIELLSWNQHIVLNSVFIVLAGIGAILEKGIKREHKRVLASIKF